MTTTEKNKIIAEFMGLENGKQLGYDKWHQDWFDNRGAINGQRNTYLLFDSDWNWLMSVVEKIENLSYAKGRYFYLHKSSAFVQIKIDRMNINLFSMWGIGGRNVKEGIYNSVFEFIQWYNQNKS